MGTIGGKKETRDKADKHSVERGEWENHLLVQYTNVQTIYLQNS